MLVTIGRTLNLKLRKVQIHAIKAMLFLYMNQTEKEQILKQVQLKILSYSKIEGHELH